MSQFSFPRGSSDSVEMTGTRQTSCTDKPMLRENIFSDVHNHKKTMSSLKYHFTTMIFMLVR